MKHEKVSQMVLGFAGDFISTGKTPEERKNRLTSACTAWKYACVPEKVTAELLEKYIAEYGKWNPGVDAKECKAIRQDMEKLIAQKQKKYPQVRQSSVKQSLNP